MRSRPLLALLVAFPVHAQIVAAPPEPPRAVAAPPSVCAAFDASVGTLQSLPVPTGAAAPSTVDVLLAGVPRRLLLAPHEVRASGYRLLVADAAGTRAVAPGPCTTLRGSVDGLAGSAVAASRVAAGLQALIRLADGTIWAIQPLREVDPTAPAGLHFVHRAADARPLPYRCGVVAPPAPPSPPGASPAALFTCELACEADLPFFQQNGSSALATQNDILAVVNAVDLIYRAEVDIAYTVTSVLVRTAADPYTTTDPAGLLSQFQAHWNTSQTGVVRDVAHLFTGRPMWNQGGVIGIAYISAVCQSSGAYGVSQSRFSGNLVQRTGLTAHELGHNWSANHCDGGGDCRIMCSYLGGCSGNLGSFSAGEQVAIEGYRNICGCLHLQASPPTISAVTPSTVPAWQPPQISLSGQGFLGTTQVQVGATTLAAGQFTVVDDSSIRFDAPAATAAGLLPVTVVNPAGTSNPGGLTVTGVAPPQLRAPAGALGGLLLLWDFAGQPAGPWFLLVSFQPTTAPVLGWPLLQSFGVVGSGVLSPAGLGSLAVVLPVGVLHGATLHAQVAEIDSTPTLAGTSAVQATRIFF